MADYGGVFPPASGSGTEGDPYIITTVDELQGMWNALAAWWELGGNIDASATATWNPVDAVYYKGFNPIGDECNRFTGHFDGKGYSINSMHILRNDQYDKPNGLFCATNGATIKRVTMGSCDIEGGKIVGALVGTAYDTTIDDCHSDGSIKGIETVGGLVGEVGELLVFP